MMNRKDKMSDDVLTYWKNPFQSSIPTSIEHLNGFGFQNLNQQQGMGAIDHNPIISDQVFSSKFQYSDSSINIGHPGSFIPTQHFGVGSSLKNVASTSIFNNGSLVAPSPAHNLCQQKPFHQILCDKGFPMSANASFGGPSITNVASTNMFNDGLSATKVFHNHCNTQAGTYLRPRVQMPAPQQPDQWASQLQVRDYSNGFKIRRLNPSCAPSDLPSLDPWPNSIGGQDYMSGTLMDIFKQGWEPVDQLPFEEWPNSSEQFMGNGPEESSKPSPDYLSCTLMDVYNSFFKFSDSTKDVLQNSEDTSGPKVNNVQPESRCKVIVISDSDSDSASEYDEPLKFLKSESTKDVMQNSEVASGPKVNKVQPESRCDEKVISDLNSASKYHELGLESMQSVKPNVFESKKMSTQNTSAVHNGLEQENIKKLVNSVEEKGSDSRTKNTKRCASMADCCEDVAPVIKKQRASLAESSELRPEPMTIKKHSASLVHHLTSSQINEHLSSFNPSKKDLSGTTTSSDVSQTTCQLCAKSKLLLAPTPVICSSCDTRIKQNAQYYQSTNKNTNALHNFCKRCYKGSGGSTISTLEGGTISKLSLQLNNNDEEIEDSWVLCDKCEIWYHRICGLYNNETDLDEKSEYICPKCCLIEIENGTRMALPKSSLQAKDLPRTNLSDHMEKRLFRRMKEERKKTAKSLGMETEEVSKAKDLVIRVVVSLDKELEVNKQFRDIFDGNDYPEKMKYRSKLILLFQNRGGVDTCLFGIYVQEFGSDCSGPNNRCAYISYIDSVRYFQPERLTASGEPLRTFVYHEILLGYLEHCKKRGFASCHIWSCPLIKGEDYIFYCHPENQKTPKKEKLRQWYEQMIKKATDDGIAVGQTDVYTEFFGPSNSKIIAGRLPYFEGDCWSHTAVNISKRLDEQESSGGRSCVKSRAKRSLMSSRQETSTKAALVMRELGDTLLPEKKNLMIVRLRHTCTSCNEVILSRRWFCKQCNKIQFCSSCFYQGNMGRCRSCKNTALSEEDLQSYVPISTWDNDDVLVNNFFETRDDFMGKCQNSLYQFDTLNHAKYSSMMILYHLKHNLVIQPKADTCHTPNEIPPSAEVPSEPKTGQSHELNPELLARLVNALDHVTQCESEAGCNPDCQRVKELLRHASECGTGKHKGCKECHTTWQILTEHISICTNPNCDVPCCMDIRRQRTIKSARRVRAR